MQACARSCSCATCKPRCTWRRPRRTEVRVLGSLAGLWTLARCGVLLLTNSTTLDMSLAWRDGRYGAPRPLLRRRVVVNLWHGIPLKRLFALAQSGPARAWRPRRVSPPRAPPLRRPGRLFGRGRLHDGRHLPPHCPRQRLDHRPASQRFPAPARARPAGLPARRAGPPACAMWRPCAGAVCADLPRHPRCRTGSAALR